ncbi:MAG: hypothetical protein ACSHXI_11885 [Hoeflea sp.]|uniref:hypothetical protein n=1 Tax=Hoeflea sp. TaxID=1940281 RepID=UPI003EFB2DAA
MSGLAANADHRAAALIGEDNPHHAVMADALNNDAAVVGADHVSPAEAHATGLVDGAPRLADVACLATMPFKPVPATAMTFETIPATAPIAFMDADAGAIAAERKLETDAAGIGGGGGSGDASSGDNEGGECIADEGVHGCSPDLAAFHALSVSLISISRLDRLTRSIDPTLGPPA